MRGLGGVIARVVLIGVVVIGAAATYPALKILPHFAEPPGGPAIGLSACRRVETGPGPEDLEIDWPTRRVYVSSFDRRAPPSPDGRLPNGRILLFDLDAPELYVDAVTAGPDIFRPHGMSLERDRDGRARRLLVINHADQGGRIEYFDIGEAGDLTHTGGWTPGPGEPAAPRPNDLAATGDGGFLLSNLAPTAGFWGELGMASGLPLGPVLSRLDETRPAERAVRLFIPNGVAVLDGGRTAVIAEFGERRLALFDRAPETGALTRRGEIDLPGAPDNITVSPNGALMVALQPHFGEMLGHRNDAQTPASSRVVRVDPGVGRWEIVLDAPAALAAQTPERISSASVAAALEDTLVVGGVFDPFLLICDLRG